MITMWTSISSVAVEGPVIGWGGSAPHRQPFFENQWHLLDRREMARDLLKKAVARSEVGYSARYAFPPG